MINANKVFFAVLFIITSYSLNAAMTEEGKIFLTELNTKNAEYYSDEKLVNPSEVWVIIEEIGNSTALTDNEKLFLKLEAYALWANISVPSGTFKEDYPTLKDFYKSVQDKAFKNGSLTSEVYTSFADFASAMIPLANMNKDSYSYNFSVDSEEYARVALIKNPANTKASVLYGMAASMIIKYPSNQKVAKSVKLLKNTEGLPEYMLFRTHIYRSMMYMKVNEIEKSFEELAKAESIYPNAFFVSMLKTSYVNGGTGFTDADRSDLNNF